MGTFRGIDTLDDLKRWLPGASIDADAAANAPASVGKPKKQKPAKLITPGIAIVEGRLLLMVAAETRSEINQRAWKAKARRTGMAWQAVRKAIGTRLSLLEPFAVAYADQLALRVTMTRLGGRKLDGMANLGTAMKGAEDALAYLLGANDGDPRWQARAEQEPNEDVGVRIEIEIIT